MRQIISRSTFSPYFHRVRPIEVWVRKETPGKSGSCDIYRFPNDGAAVEFFRDNDWLAKRIVDCAVPCKGEKLTLKHTTDGWIAVRNVNGQQIDIDDVHNTTAHSGLLWVLMIDDPEGW